MIPDRDGQKHYVAPGPPGPRNQARPPPTEGGSGQDLRHTGERELVLAAKASRGEARIALIEAFTPLILDVARTYRRDAGVSCADVMQDGVAGLLQALERFDPDLGTPFWAYASWWVRQAMACRAVSSSTRRPWRPRPP